VATEVRLPFSAVAAGRLHARRECAAGAVPWGRQRAPSASRPLTRSENLDLLDVEHAQALEVGATARADQAHFAIDEQAEVVAAALARDLEQLLATLLDDVAARAGEALRPAQEPNRLEAIERVRHDHRRNIPHAFHRLRLRIARRRRFDDPLLRTDAALQLFGHRLQLGIALHLRQQLVRRGGDALKLLLARRLLELLAEVHLDRGELLAALRTDLESLSSLRDRFDARADFALLRLLELRVRERHRLRRVVEDLDLGLQHPARRASVAHLPPVVLLADDPQLRAFDERGDRSLTRLRAIAERDALALDRDLALGRRLVGEVLVHVANRADRQQHFAEACVTATDAHNRVLAERSFVDRRVGRRPHAQRSARSNDARHRAALRDGRGRRGRDNGRGSGR